MTYSLAAASVNPANIVSTQTIATSFVKNATSSNAIDIGNLTEQSAVVDISEAGLNAGSPVSSTFTAQDGDLTTLSEDLGNIVDQADTHYQLFDSAGDLIADNQGDTAQQTAYSQWVNAGLNLSADTYTAIATPQSNVGLSVTTNQTQGTSISVSSQLTGSDSTEFYNFALTAGNNIKLAYDAGAQSPSTRVQILNSTGQVIADSDGNAFEQANYYALTSGSGLAASPGNYSIEVSYKPGIDPDSENINYNFQLYSGSTYSTVYQNKITAQPTDTTASGSVTATSDAQLYSRNSFNTISETALTAVQIGWLTQDKSALQVSSQLTPVDSTDFFTFTLQQGDNLKFGFNSSSTNTSALRVQLYDRTGSYLIADSDGTAAQQAAYKSLTTTDGLTAKPGNYTVKISYLPGVAKTTNSYTFGLYSGTSYNALYTTTASAQTFGNAALTGGAQGYSSAVAAASYLSAEANGYSTDITAALTSTI